MISALRPIAAPRSLSARPRVVKTIAKGFAGGSNNKGLDDRKRGSKSLSERLSDESSPSSSSSSSSSSSISPGKDWIRTCSVKEFAPEKPRKIFERGGGDIPLLLLKVDDGEVYCCNVESTAYQFPLIDGKVSRVDAPGNKVRWIIETPLDGTTYYLDTGAVKEWCPTQGANPFRGLLSTLKKAVVPIPLTVHKVAVVGEDVYVKVSAPAV